MDPFLPVDASALALLLGTLLPSLSADSAWHAYIWQVLEKATLKSKVASADRRAQAVRIWPAFACSDD